MEYVNIPDANLAAKLREALNKSSGDSITAEEMATLTSLLVGASGISDLTGLEHAVNITDLRIWSNQITDLSPLAYMTNLETLYSYGNSVNSISPLANLTKLNFLNSGWIEDGDISPLTNLTELRTLWLDGNNLSDISPLSNLPKVTYLQLGNNGLTDISALSSLTNLWFLNIKGNNITDYSPLDSLTSLSELQSDQPAGNTTLTADTAGPEITSVTFSHGTATSGEEVTVTVKAEDAESDVEGVFISIINPGGGGSVQTCNIGAQSSQCETSISIGSGDFQMLGTYVIDWVSAADSFGNTTYAASWGDSDVSRPGFVGGQ